jgi:serine/threonine-protein kinase
VEAAKLRSRLQTYYREAGKASTVVIELPKGAYVPVFRTVEQPQPLRIVMVLLISAAALAAAVTGVVLWKRASSPPVSSITSIAVLPFLNLSPDPSEDYISDGVTEEVIQSLALLEGLRVISQTSSFAFKGKRMEARDVGLRLRVQFLVEGSVRKMRDQFRISAIGSGRRRQPHLVADLRAPSRRSFRDPEKNRARCG